MVDMELEIYFLAHLTDTIVEGDSVDFHFDVKNFTERDRNVVKYLSGYVFGELYRRIRFSEYHRKIINIQTLSILKAGKADVDDLNPDDRLINARNCGGLWNVTRNVFDIFIISESYFRAKTDKKVLKKIDSYEMVSDLASHSGILALFSKIRNSTAEKVPKEIALNLLERVLELYLRARTFSLVKDRKEIFKLEAKRRKTKSLLKSIKKCSSSLELGH